jgi:dolichol-phosphate mannosyltransferase
MFNPGLNELAPTSERSQQPQSPERPRVMIVLPAFNEEESLPPLLDALHRALDGVLDYLVVVVDDGSSDNTAMIASNASFRMPVLLVRHDKNAGLAAAIRTGFTVAVREAGPDDVIVTMDADNTQPPGLMPRMLTAISEGHDVVIASRYRTGSRVLGVPLHRNLMSLGARLLFTVSFPIRGVRDYTCGYRAYRAAVIARALADYGDRFVTEKGFSCMVDVLLKLRSQPLVFGEVPMILRYDQKGGASKMKVAKTAVQTLSLIARRRLRGTK